MNIFFRLFFGPIPPFNRWMLATNGTTPSLLNCSRVLANDTDYIAQLAKQRIQYTDPPELDMDCERGIRWRNYFPQRKDQFEDYPLAQARIVYKVGNFGTKLEIYFFFNRKNLSKNEFSLKFYEKFFCNGISPVNL